jgi:hypothetical protein
MKTLIKSLFAVLLLVVGFSINATAQRNVKVTESFQYTKTPANGAALISNASGAASWGSVTSTYLKATVAVAEPDNGDTVLLARGTYNVVAPTDSSITMYWRLPSSPANGDIVEIQCTANCNDGGTINFLNGTVATTPITADRAYIKLVYVTSKTAWY